MSGFILRQTNRHARVLFLRSNGGIKAMGLRGLMVPSQITYTAKAKASGSGRNGSIQVADASPPLASPINLALPKAMGGSGQGSNPEQLFSAGYAGCFLGALQLCAKKAGKDASGATVEVLTGIGPADSAEGFALNIELKISGFNDEAVVNAAHQLCPYSRALVHGVKPTLTIV